jgi:ABC-type cobalamin/Fe3+-siderophores transport system ATPase subunit
MSIIKIKNKSVFLHPIMMLELLNITIGEVIKDLSLTVSDGQLLSVVGDKGAGKTTLLRAILGFLPVDEGYISIDGELLTPLSAPYFRRQMAYVPQRLSLPDGYDKVPTDYVALLERAVSSGKQLLLIDEPSDVLTDEQQQRVDDLLAEAQQRGATILAINQRFNENIITL